MNKDGGSGGTVVDSSLVLALGILAISLSFIFFLTTFSFFGGGGGTSGNVSFFFYSSSAESGRGGRTILSDSGISGGSYLCP